MNYSISSPHEWPADPGLNVVRVPEDLWNAGVDAEVVGEFDPDELATLFVRQPFPSLPEQLALRIAVTPDGLLRVLMSRNAQQSSRVIRWAGLRWRPELLEAWNECVSELQGEPIPGVPAVRRDGCIFAPRSFWIAKRSHSPLVGLSKLATVLAAFRAGLLDQPQAAGWLERYLRTLSLDDPLAKLLGEMIDPVRLPVLPVSVQALLGYMDRVRSTQPEEFREFASDQAELWRAFHAACYELRALRRDAEMNNAHVRANDWYGSNRALREHLRTLADSYAVLSRYEKFWNVDKNLAPVLLRGDFRVLKQLMSDVRRLVFERTAEFRDVYQREWGLSTLRRAVFKALGVTSDRGLPPGIPGGQERIVLFVIDGLGYTQYAWWQAVSPRHTRWSLGANVFKLLAERSEFNDTALAAANLSSDTGSGLASLFTGMLPAESGILATYMKVFDRPVGSKNVRVLDDPEPVWDPQVTSWIDELPQDVVVWAIHGGSRTQGLFSKRLYGRAQYVGLDNPERAASRIVEALGAAHHGRVVVTVYYPLIDRAGHDVGSFSLFEQNELQRLNTLLLTTLLDLAEKMPCVYDGRTTIFITSDHGMYESTDVFVTKQQMLDALNEAGVWAYLHIMARAVWLYASDPEPAISALEPLLRDAAMHYEVHRKGDSLITTLLGRSKYVPDAAIILTGDGMFVPFHTTRSDVLLYGVHGGRSPEEVFTPFITLQLTPQLRSYLLELYGHR